MKGGSFFRSFHSYTDKYEEYPNRNAESIDKHCNHSRSHLVCAIALPRVGVALHRVRMRLRFRVRVNIRVRVGIRVEVNISRVPTAAAHERMHGVVCCGVVAQGARRTLT